MDINTIDLNGKTAFITGSTQGIGLAIAKVLSQLGAKVIIHGRSREKVQRIIQEEYKYGFVGFAIPLDDPNQIDNLLDEMLNKYKVDILVNNAGIGKPLRFEETTLDYWKHVYQVNLFSHIQIINKLLPYMKERAWGRIINISSSVAENIKPYFPAYSSSKAALVHITKVLAQTCAENNILVNCILPGSIKTEMTQYAIQMYSSKFGVSIQESEYYLYTKNVALKRMGDPRDIANFVAYLCSEAANFINGACIPINGGVTI
ncbi:SDR family NAD(P)-dependent oxidoreductase [Thermoflavimicrobium dichotomicum]|uniref:NAD(P)-dependent dehydrogenase, short-chain alcohol dehydrogenase family n=1 Tax=Thermoflavimicrobium dichotomicum TaxID=46223 RepID=A0A1I3U1S3_9BACL|nr:SDR family oxidoreductase [Thermoflavimicrobium dichotomicum]SFJ77494.1 NAD(P)-dependent dehydrogenase, short-chain alcohol dehydrogenase family [Thermoflavimicrobium dichotomicum]